MSYFFRYVVLLLAIVLTGAVGYAQNKQWREMHKVKRGETVFGIAREYGITINELIKANPEMNNPRYELKKGDYVFIPYPAGEKTSASNKSNAATATRAVRVGVVLPLHNVDGDGRRMVEYYRGLLLACNELKKEGVSIDVSAWNLPIDGDVNHIIGQTSLAQCDVIFGPLYTKQVRPLADFAKNNGIKLVIPFSINGDDVSLNPNIFQVYQSPEFFYDEVISHFVYRFSNYHVVVIDCNDKSSDKGVFTFGLRKRLDERGISNSVTNLKSSDDMFAKAFSATKPNMVVLNTGRSPELTQAIAKIDAMTTKNPSMAISMFGYTEWLMYTNYNKDKFFKYDAYIPTAAYYNTYSSKVKLLENKYVSWFKCSMMDYLPRFAITGYDHGLFFLRGLSKQGSAFNGTEANGDALQNPLHFRRVNGTGGYQNTSFMFVHYNRNRTISTINF